jgi:hypothetical protein
VSFTAGNNGTGVATLTQAEMDQNQAAVEARKSGVLGCIGKSSVSSTTSPGCNDPCSTADCLKKLLTGNLLDQDAKKLLCDMMTASERALKRQIDSAGDSLLDAAEDLASANALRAPLNTLNNALSRLDPGAVAKCFGAQALIDKARGQLNKVNKTITAAENGVHDKLAAKFNKGTEALQQFSLTPNACA